MKITIEMDLENAEFMDLENAEFDDTNAYADIPIRAAITAAISRVQRFDVKNSVRIKDSNGNTVGTLTISE